MVSELLLIDCPRGCDPHAVERLHRASIAAFGRADVQVSDQARAGDSGAQLYLLSFETDQAREAFLLGEERSTLERSWRAVGARWMIGDFAKALCAAHAPESPVFH